MNFNWLFLIEDIMLKEKSTRERVSYEKNRVCVVFSFYACGL